MNIEYARTGSRRGFICFNKEIKYLRNPSKLKYKSQQDSILLTVKHKLTFMVYEIK